jgi:glycosyltransferase involved in cell wall biosynthesis
VNTKPNVLIMIATDAIGGPGKGLFHFLKHAPTGAFDYILCNFNLKNRPMGQFVQEARRRGLRLMLLRQRATIDPALILEARRVVREHGINVVQTHGYKSNVLGFFLHFFTRTPWIGFAHGYTDDNWKMRLYNRLDRFVLRCADRIVTVSDSMRALLITHGVERDRIRLIYNAIDMPDSQRQLDRTALKQAHGIASGRRVIGVIGRLNPEKGQRVFLNALRQVVATCPDVAALIVGEGQDREALERYAYAHGLSGNVIFTGYLENVLDYYGILDLLVVPSLSEGLPNAVLEAMSFGVPVLATRVGGIPEIIGDGNGVLVEPDDPQALADRIVELLSNEPLRMSIAATGRNSLYPRFDPDHRARQIVSVYEELLTASHGREPSHV